MFLVPQHSICIVYHVSKKLWSKGSEICVYVDGELARSTVMKVPSFSDVSQNMTVYTTVRLALNPGGFEATVG